MTYQLDHATYDDLDALMQIVHDAQELMRSNGINQWQNGYPNRPALIQDIDQSCLYVLRAGAFDQDFGLSADTPVAMAAILHSPEPDYAKIDPIDPQDPASPHSWSNPEAKYMVIHRVAVARATRGKHVAGPFYDACLAFAFGELAAVGDEAQAAELRANEISEVRVDTHPDNASMQALIESRGFTHQGLIYVQDKLDAGRIAYTLTREDYINQHR